MDGSYHTPADQEIADQILVGAPHLPYSVRAYRMLLRRMVRELVGAGVRQFIDLGSGLPTAGNVHEVAQGLDPASRVVYVDIAEDIVTEGRELLSDNDNATVVRADLRWSDQVFAAVAPTRLIDRDAPVAVLMIDVLHHVEDDDRPADVVRGYVDALCPGSYLAVAHTTDSEALLDGLALFHRFYHVPIPPLAVRSPEQITGFFQGLDLVEPGVVPVPLWRSGPDDDPGANPENFPGHCGLGRKP